MVSLDENQDNQRGEIVMKRQLILSIIAVLFIGLTSSAFADHRDYQRYSKDEIRELGARRGYDMGYRSGQTDARGGHKLDYKHDPDYKFGLVGYRGEYQHDGAYKDGFRKGFERAYREAYEREYYNGRRGNNGGGWGNWGWGNNRNNRPRY
jgi:hypothetical protein